jgi:diadenosine tetraphosphate (Ap4A) HIT family hydrolase
MVKDIFNKEWECGCLGCSIATGEVVPPGGIIAQTKNFVLHQDPEVPIKAFLIIGAKKHIKSITQLNQEEAQELFDLVYRARIALKGIEDIKEISIIQEESRGHFHLWLLPRYEWMNNIYSNSLSSIREMMVYMQNSHKTEENIKDILANIEFIKESFN